MMKTNRTGTAELNTRNINAIPGRYIVRDGKLVRHPGETGDGTLATDTAFLSTEMLLEMASMNAEFSVTLKKDIGLFTISKLAWRTELAKLQLCDLTRQALAKMEVISSEITGS